MHRAAAANARAVGADGLYLSGLPWPHSEREYQVFRELGDPDVYRRKAKHYLLGHREPIGPFTAREAPRLRDRDSILRFDTEPEPDPFSPERFLPIKLEEGNTAQVDVFVGDDLNAARVDGALRRLTLGVRIMQRCSEDRLTFRFNGRELPLEGADIDSYYSGIAPHGAHRWGLPMRIWTHDWFHFSLSLELLMEGRNILEVTMDHRHEEMTADRVLHQVELRVEYKEPPLPRDSQVA